LDDDDDDDDDNDLFLNVPGFLNRNVASRPVMATTSTVPPSTAAATKRPTMTPTPRNKVAKKPKKKQKPFALIWVCTHGKGRSRNWRKKDLNIVGVYGSKSAAEAAKGRLMEQHECCGHGDIMVGWDEDDEIDLVIREAPTFMDEE
jgi:hypothetical protein